MKKLILIALLFLSHPCYAQQIDSLNANKEAELKAAENDAVKKEMIEKNYAKKVGDIRRKQAMVDKVTALFNIALSTAMGVANASSKVVTLPLVPYIIAQGVIQAALVVLRSSTCIDF